MGIKQTESRLLWLVGFLELLTLALCSRKEMDSCGLGEDWDSPAGTILDDDKRIQNIEALIGESQFQNVEAQRLQLNSVKKTGLWRFFRVSDPVNARELPEQLNVGSDLGILYYIYGYKPKLQQIFSGQEVSEYKIEVSRRCLKSGKKLEHYFQDYSAQPGYKGYTSFIGQDFPTGGWYSFAQSSMCSAHNTLTGVCPFTGNHSVFGQHCTWRMVETPVVRTFRCVQHKIRESLGVTTNRNDSGGRDEYIKALFHSSPRWDWLKNANSTKVADTLRGFLNAFSQPDKDCGR